MTRRNGDIMEFEKINIRADLGTGEFRVSRFVRSVGNRLSEIPMADGYFDREIAGGEVLLTLEGTFDVQTEGSFFEELLDALAGVSLADAEIAGVTYPLLAAVRAETVLSVDSRLGRYRIVLKEKGS